MAPEPFAVAHPGPDFLIIAFMGHDNNLSAHLERHLNEMAMGAGRDVAIIAVTDVSFGPAYVFEITSGTRRILKALGEIDTGDGALLARLLARALVSYPGMPRIAIGFSGHGSGVFDEEPPDQLARAFALLGNPAAHALRSLRTEKMLKSAFSVLNDRPRGQLTNRELGDMLGSAFRAAGRQSPVDLLFFDTCLNGMIEIVTEFAPYARCVVASEDNEPDDGWRYDKWLARMQISPPPDAAAWGGQAVEAVAEAYARRADVVTLSAVAAGPGPLLVVARFKALIDAAAPLGRAGYEQLDWARSQSRIFADAEFDSYDLCDFASHLIRRNQIPVLTHAAGALIQAVNAAVLYKTPPNAATAYGLAFWFPEIRRSFEKDVNTYRLLRFDRETGWSDYLRQYL
jgi:hypothetical protein